jgi:hypothetical protein
VDLLHYEERHSSQNGEDGLLRRIFDVCGTTDRYVVEFGADLECCSMRLVVEDGWDALFIDADSSRVGRIRERAPRAQVVNAFIRLDNIVDLFHEASVPSNFDLLIVDIDGNDYWVLQRLLGKYRPRAIVCEYNARWVPPREWIMPYDPDHVWDGSARFGASLTSLDKLMRAHGYRLIACDSHGINAFFVSHELASRFREATLPVVHLYRTPAYARGFGHPIRAASRL